MGKTISEKILAKAAGKKEVSPGEYVIVKSPNPIVCGMGLEGYSEDFWKDWDPKRIMLVATHDDSVSQARCIKWAKETGIPEENLFLWGRGGIDHNVAYERAWALPGTVYLHRTDGGSQAQGGLGCFAVALNSEGSEKADPRGSAYIRYGVTWLRVPKTVKINITGELQDGVVARDVAEYSLGQIGPIECSYKAQEWTGPVVEKMSMDGRFNLCINANYFSAKTGIVNPDAKTIKYVRARTTKDFEPLVSDEEAQFDKTFNFDVNNIDPQIVPPPKRYIVKSVKEFVGTKITRGFIGTCETGIDDIRLAARILKGTRVKPDVRLDITHVTTEILKQSVREGLYETFIDAGVELPMPGCGICQRSLIMGDVCIATNPCNYPGRMGSLDAQIYLGSSATVAASCIEGKIVDPREYL